MQLIQQIPQDSDSQIEIFKNIKFEIPEDLLLDSKLQIYPKFQGPPNDYQEGDRCDKLVAFVFSLLIIGFFIILSYIIVIWVLFTDSYTYALIWVCIGTLFLFTLLGFNSFSKEPKSYWHRKTKERILGRENRVHEKDH